MAGPRLVRFAAKQAATAAAAAPKTRKRRSAAAAPAATAGVSEAPKAAESPPAADTTPAASAATASDATGYMENLQTSVFGAGSDVSIGEFLRHEGSGNKRDLFLAHFDSLIELGEISSADQMYQRTRKPGITLDVERFNNLLAFHTSQGYWGKLQTCFALMQEDGVQPNYVTMAHCLRCFQSVKRERWKNKDIRRRFDFFMDHFLERGLDPNRLFAEIPPLLLSDTSKTLITDLLKQMMPDFDPLPASSAPAPPEPISAPRPMLKTQWERETGINVVVKPVLTYDQEKQLKRATVRMLETEPEPGESLFGVWHEPVAKVLAEDRDRFFAGDQSDFRRKHGQIYNVLPVEELASIVLTEMERDLVGNEFGTKVSALASEVGRAVFKRYFVKQNLQQGISRLLEEVYVEYERIMSDHELRKQHPSPTKLHKQKYPEDSVGTVVAPWPVKTMVQVGTALVHYVISSASLSRLTGSPADNVAAFYHTYEFVAEKQLGFVKAHDMVHEIAMPLQKTGRRKETEMLVGRSYDASMLPMLTMPKPWASVRHGPYLITPVNVMRCAEDTFQHFSLLAAAEHAIGDVFDALTVLSSTPWTINEPVFQTAQTLFKDGEEHSDVEIAPFSIPVPSKPEDYSTCPEARRKYLGLMRQAKQKRMENSSLRCDLSLKLNIANDMRGRKFYLPHNMDFRGRAYVLPPHLTHLGSDLSRGLLLFDEKRPLGEGGLRWLKIHLANVFGQDKCSFDDRVAFVDEHLDDVLDSARDPLGTTASGEKRWWRRAENPWQALAACNEISGALGSGDPASFLSGLPVHQDGTCNGLQHYAALGGDIEGARHVNLSPSDEDRPQDVYSAVADLVNKILREHAAGDFSGSFEVNGKSTANKYQRLARMLIKERPIGRKIVKQTVMTNVYGVTFVGGREQILRQLKAAKVVKRDYLFDAAQYLTACVFQSLGEMFTSAQAIQHWLSETARLIARTGDPVAWLTPMNLPVVQPYHKPYRRLVNTLLQHVSIVNRADTRQRPNITKQKSAFPPNYIHSLDSTHMMYTALGCHRAGVSFVAVHDSFWTHAATVDVMNRICREEFVHLHSQPLLERLRAFFQLHYEGRQFVDKNSGTGRRQRLEIPMYPKRGDFDVREVLDSKYFFN